MEHINCVICETDNSQHIMSGRDYRYGTTDEIFRIVKCRSCGLHYVDPRPRKEDIQRYYPGDYRPRRTVVSKEYINKKIKKFRDKRKAGFLKNPWYIDFPAGKKVLDIGCGAGELLLRLQERSCHPYGIDFDDFTSARLREIGNFDVRTCDIDSGTPFSNSYFDIVIMRHSLEHMFNPSRVLKEVNRITQEGGDLIIGILNIDSYVARITGIYWNILDIPRHLFHFSPETITRLLMKNGFAVDSIAHKFKISKES